MLTPARVALAAGAVGAAAVAPSATAASPAPSRAHVREYLHAYYAVQREFGHRAPGRQILAWGFAPGQPATDLQVVTSLGVLNRMLAPPPSVQTSTPTSSTPSTSTNTASGSTGGGGWAIPSSVVQCESGGQNLPPNSAGASGYYQDLASTWNGYGGYSAAYLAPKSVQDAFNAGLWNGGQGTSQWVCK